MAQAADSVVISRPRAEVWAVLRDFEAIAQWASNVDHSCLTSDLASGIGAVRRVQVGRTALLERVVAWEDEVRLGYAIEGLPPVLRSVTNTWELTDAADSTEVRLTTEVDVGPRPPQQAIARAVSKRMAKEGAQLLAGLRARVEATP